MYQFFYAPNSCSLASHLALEFSGADYQANKVDLAHNEQREAEYLNLNPKGRVPVLVTESGTITENPAILLFLAMSYPAAKLAPLEDAFALAQVMSVNAYLSSTVHVAHAHGVRGTRWADDPGSLADMKRKAPAVMVDCFTLIEDKLLAGPWILGDQFSISDLYLFTISQWLEADQVDPRQFPKVYDHRTRLRDDEVVARVIAGQ